MFVVVLGAESLREHVRDADIAGIPFHALLAASVADSPHVEFLESAAAAASRLQAGDTVLCVDPDVWMPRHTLESIASASRELLESFVVHGGTLTADGSGKDVLAACLRGDALQGSRDLDLIVNASVRELVAKLTAAAPVRSMVLDPSFPARRVRDALDIAEVEVGVLYARACDAMRAGVRIRDPRQISIRGTLTSAAGVTIDVGVIIEGSVTLEPGASIGPYCVLADAFIGRDTRVRAYSMIEHATVHDGASIGPYARIRPGTTIGEFGQIGNFVEIKNSTIGERARINHLTFIGDATLENRVTIGAGTITCNHDGVGAVVTHIGEGAYIGSGCELVAPIAIGRHATIGAGSTVTQDAPAGALTIARARQVTIPDWDAETRSKRVK